MCKPRPVLLAATFTTASLVLGDGGVVVSVTARFSVTGSDLPVKSRPPVAVATVVVLAVDVAAPVVVGVVVVVASAGPSVVSGTTSSGPRLSSIWWTVWILAVLSVRERHRFYTPEVF